MADVVVINKVIRPTPEQVAEVRANVASMNGHARVILARSALTLVGGDVAGSGWRSSRTVPRSRTAA